MKSTIIIVLSLALALPLLGQVSDRRYTFAKTYFGLDLNYVPNFGKSYFLNPQNTPESFQRSAFLTPAINIGATHFWGHADFFVSITTSNIKSSSDAVNNSTRFGAMTGLRLYPFALNDHQFRPFAGYKFAPIRYSQESLSDEGHIQTQVKSILDLGIAYRSPKLYAYLGYNLIFRPELDVYLSRNLSRQSNYPKHFISLGMNYMLETTAGSYSGITPKLDQLLAKKNRYGLFFGIGPSAAFPIRDSEYLSEDYPFLDQRTMPSIFPDVSAGYHFSKMDASVVLAFRPIRQQRTAFGFQQKAIRLSLVLEAYKYLFDYHGFAPFLGAGISMEQLRLRESDGSTAIWDFNESKNAVLLTAGWDIRPSRRADVWLLRTNLRYAPQLSLSPEGKKLSFEQLEFNFIQLVVYPQRIKAIKQLKTAPNGTE